MRSQQHYTQIMLALPGIGPGKFWQYLDHFASAEQVLLEAPIETFPESARKVVTEFRRSPENCEAANKVNQANAWFAENHITVLDTEHESYPHLLKHIKSVPPLLYVSGNVEALTMPQIAVVGSRQLTAAGAENAHRFCRELAKHGFAITSGLALGADTAAHQGALEAKGVTVAVMGTGIDCIYPKRNRTLAELIVANNGAIVSEFPLGTAPTATNFPRRNRIISGLSYGTLVVEAAVKSGSLITARYALEQDREVFAIPGSIHNPVARGCHQLIRQGATLVETAQDIVEQLQGFISLGHEQLNAQRRQQVDLFEDRASKAEAKPKTMDPTKTLSQVKIMAEINSEEQSILSAMSFELCSLDDLVERCQQPVGDLMAKLTQLELKGLISCGMAGYQRTSEYQA